MTKRAAIYARYSSDLQNDRSIEDQVALCQAFADRQGYAVVTAYHDRARSGASMMGRDGLLSLMDAARDGAFDVVVVEALDRISRDQEDLAGVFKRLKHRDIEICAVHDGRADIIQIGIRGLVGALYLQDLGHKVRRGLAGVIRDGRSAGGRPYGYQIVLGKPGELVIDPAEASVVERIFRCYAAGLTPRDIAKQLNDDGIVSPRDSYWHASTINGNRKRGNGILQNPIYDGRLVWNRVHMVKDPDTGRRLSRVNPESEWQSVDVEQLRIVPRDLFEKVNGLRARCSSKVYRRDPKRLLSGLIKCGACGAGMSIHSKMGRITRIVCTRAREARSCDNRKPYSLEAIEALVVGGLKGRLGSRQAIDYFVAVYNDEKRRAAAGSGADRERAALRLVAVNRAFERAAKLAIDGVLSDDEARAQLDQLRAERAGIEALLSAMPEAPKVIHLKPAIVSSYLRLVKTLEETLKDQTAIAITARDTIREMVETVTVYPDTDHAPIEVEVRGTLSRFLEDAPPLETQTRWGAVVAGSGFEPPTPGL